MARMIASIMPRQFQAEMHQCGRSDHLGLYLIDILKLLIWDAAEAFQKRLRDLCDRAIEAEGKSATILTKAKHRVEQLIEQAIQ